MNKQCLATAICVVAIAAPCLADNIPWEHDLAKVQQLAASKQRLVLLHFTAASCPPCRAIERNVYSKAEFVRSLTSNYIPVKIDGPAHAGLCEKLGVHAWPTDVVMTPTGEKVYQGTSPQDMNQYISLLDSIAAHQRAGMQHPVASNAQPVIQQVQQTVQNNVHVPDRASQFVPPGGAPQNVTNQYVTQQQPPVNPRPQPGMNVSTVRTPNQPIMNPHIAPPQQQPPAPTEQAQAPPYQPNVAPQRPVDDGVAPLPVKSPPIALDGFCPVSLVDGNQWQEGSTQWGLIHRGKLYLFSSADAKARFWADGDRYSPVMAGYDVVQYIDVGALREGRRQFGSYYGGKYYLFDSESSLAKFDQTPYFYANKADSAVAENDKSLRR